jgi:acetyltransferase-like isoleucine patch superfamily enzyme
VEARRVVDREETSKRLRHIRTVVDEERSSLQLRAGLLTLPARLVPEHAGNRLRTYLLRYAGWRIGRRTLVFGVPRLYGSGPIQSRLTIGESVIVNVGCTFDLNDAITIGDGAAIGHEVMILTSSHVLGGSSMRAGPLFTGPVTIADGAWVGSRSVLLPGVTVGRGAVVAAGSVVTKDVPADALVGGVPAEVRRASVDDRAARWPRPAPAQPPMG